MRDNMNVDQLRRRMAVIRHRLPGRLAMIRTWLAAAATVIHNWIVPRVVRLGTELGARSATSRTGRLVAERVLRPVRTRLGRRLAGHGPQVAVAMLVLVLAGLATIGGTVGAQDPQARSTTAVQQGVLAGRDDARADRSGRTAGAAPSVAAAPTTTAAARAKPAWVAPMSNAPVTSCYGMRWGVSHLGIDFALPPGTAVHAIGPGTVTGAGWLYTGYGISVVIDHGNGYQSHYAHLKGVAVSAGQRVTVDQVIGYEGSTGDSTGPHLHFEIHHGMWNQVEPAAVLRGYGVPLTGC